MNNTVGLVVNRLVYGFTFAFLYQLIVAIATSFLSIPLTGNIQDLISGIEQIGQEGYLLIAWWIISTIIITAIALLIIRYKKYLSPYKQEKDIDIPPRITPITAIIIGSIISFLFFLLDLIIGSIVKISSATDVQAIYIAASNGDLIPLAVSIVFSIIAGFIIVGVASKTSKFKEFTKDLDITKLAELAKIMSKKTNHAKMLSDTVGLRPGALVHIGEQHVDKIIIEQIEYDKDHHIVNTFENVEDCLNTNDNSYVSWTNIIGLQNPDVVKKIGDYYKLHVLNQADIMNTELRPKLDSQDENLFLILKLPHVTKEGKIFMEQISLVIGKNFIVSFQETPDDIFDPIRKRIATSVGTIRNRGSDYLAYALIDSIIDHFYVVMDHVGAQSEILEEELISNPNPTTLEIIHTLKREMVVLRKSIWPIREVIDSLERTETELIEERTRRYFRDVYSHTVQVMDNIEGLREMIGGMLDTYLSSVGNKMNEVMKTLTIIASIFIPITFIAGLYGTNFSYVPELEWEGSYFVMLSVMTVIVIIMVAWFRKKHWL